MSFHYNPYIWIYLAAAILLTLTIIYSIYHNNKNYLWIITLSMVIIWCLGFAIQISTANIKAISFWYIFANDFIGIKSPTVLLLWALTFIGKKKIRTPLTAILLFLLPVATDIVNLTNASHGLIYPKMWLNASSGYPLLQFYLGPWYWLINIYCIIELFAVVAFIVKATVNRQLLYRTQGYTFAAFVFIVLLFIIVILALDGALFNYYDFTPVVISIVVFCSSIAFRFRTQEVIPVSRNAVIEKMTSAVLILDNQNRIMDMNKAAGTFFGLEAERVSGHSIEEELSEWKDLVGACLNKIDYSEFLSDNRYYSAYFSSLSDESKSAGSVVIIQDVTDSKQAEMRALQQKQAIITLQERNRLARELHDSLGQVLGYTNMQIETIRKMLKNSQPQVIDSSLVALSKVIEEANTEVREFIYEIRTTLIFKDGFFAAMQQYLLHFEENFNINIEIQNPDNITDEEIGLSIGVQLFRIIQEALTNVRKHSQADNVKVTFIKKDKNIIVSISDNGIGFNPDKMNCDSSYGLIVMRERASNIRGYLNIDSTSGHGTTVTVTIPLYSVSESEAELDNRTLNVDSKEDRVKVLLVDDHVLFMEGLKILIEQHGFEVVGTAKDGLEALEKSRLLYPDMILMDL